jgi:hypothetical protein
MDWLLKGLRSDERGAALIIVLAFVVLLTGLSVAYLSRTTSDRQIAHSSFHQSNVDQLAQSGMDNIIGDLRQEITNGSASPVPTFSANGSTLNLYVPCVNVGCTMPAPSPGSTACPNSTPTTLPVMPIYYPSATPGTTPAIPNLIRRSVRNDAIPCPARASRASAVNSLADASANGRSVSLARWNSHYMIPKSNTTDGGSDPITTGYAAPNYWAPDWVFVNAQGATIINTPDTTVIGRYAYMIYDEGGLLDMNAAGYPSSTTMLQAGRKGSLAFADLTGLSSYGLSTTAIDNIVGWRNYASSQPTGTLNPPGSNLSFSADAANTYYNFILSDPNNIQLPNYLVNQSPPLTYFTNSFLNTSQASAFNNQTDQALASRQMLLKLRSAVVGSGISFVNALQYLGTFSREALSKIPQWSPTTPDSINPNFQTLLVTGPFTRNDGTQANTGEYLVNRRFLLERFNWLTYKGPSATRNIPASPSLGDPDYDMWLLTRPDRDSIRFGLTSAFLQQGTAANIQKYFGLVWDSTNERWNYVGQGSSLLSSIATFGSLTSTREPDFFELLQAGILNSSLGDSATSYPELPINHQQSTMLHVLTLGANLIAQSRADSYPVRIACNVGGTTMEAVGAPRLPYINSVAACPVGVNTTTGGMNWLLVPNLWNPFRDTWDLTEQNSGNTGNKPLSTPGYLRPSIRITVGGSTGAPSIGGSGGSGTVAIGTTATVTNSGRVSSAASVATVTVPFSPLPITTVGNSTAGRDGFLQAMRLGASDFASAPASFDPTTPGSSTPTWNTVTRPKGDSSRSNDQYVVFRISSSITLPNSGSPVLILNSGFQVTMDYQSPNGTWYSYSFLQGNNATNTWITANPNPLYIASNYSVYGTPNHYTAPTVVNTGPGQPQPTDWTASSGGVGALAKAPMFAKGDPTSIRYNSQLGALTLTSSAGIIASIWPSTSSTPPPMPGATNPETLGDNAAAGNTANPYSETTGDTWRPVMMNRPFRSVGEMGYALRAQPFKTLSFSSLRSPDAGLLDLFSANDYSNSSGTRAAVVNLNSSQAPALAGVLASTARQDNTPRGSGAAPQPTPVPLASPAANSVAASLLLAGVCASPSPSPLANRAGLADLIFRETGLGTSVPKTERESIARALSETAQTRTWNLMLDVIAQSGRYPPNATSLRNGFVVQGEQRYWVHVAIDRFTGKVLDKQIEVVNE